MKNRRGWILMLLLVALVCMWGLNNRAESAARASWEYKVVSTYGPGAMNPPINPDELTALGKEGWEIVTVHSGEFPNRDSQQVRTDYYFKRMR